MYELNICKGVMCNFNEKNDGKFEEELTCDFELWPEPLEVSKTLTLMGSFRPKYLMFELKKYGGGIFHGTEKWYKIWRATELSFRNWH